MRKTLHLLALLFVTRFVFADCTGPGLSVNVATQKLAAVFPLGSKPPDVDTNKPAAVSIGTTMLHTTVIRITPEQAGVQGPTVVLEKPPDARFENGVLAFEGDLTTDQAKFGYTDTSGKEQSVDLCLDGDYSSKTESYHVGLAQAKDNNTQTAAASPTASAAGAADDKPSAIRFQYERSFRRFPEMSNDKSKIPDMRNSQQEFSINIDTTDQKGKGFVDDNRLSAGMFTPRFTVGRPLNRLRAGVHGEHARALHGGDHNSDITVAVDAGLPLLQSYTLIGSRYLAEPLQFRVQAGQRWQNVDSVRSSGLVAEGDLLYHLYVTNGYRVDLSYKTLLNDVSHRPATTPRTQHSWKAELFMFASEGSKFSAVASYENGHSGPVFTQLKQYFVGVGLKNLFATATSTP